MYDVGVAGLHRLLSNLETINTADVVIVCAGSIILCLCNLCIGVPTSASIGMCTVCMYVVCM